MDIIRSIPEIMQSIPEKIRSIPEITRSLLIILTCFTGAIVFLMGYILEIYILEIVNLSLIGVGILAIGISFLLLFREKVVREDLIPNIVIPTMYSHSAIINHFGVKGKGIYIPPTDENNECNLIVPENTKVDADRLVPPHFDTSSLFFKEGIILLPSGIGLMHLVEKEMGISFASKELSSLDDILSKSLIEILKIAENVYVNIVGNKVQIQVFNSIFFESCIRIHEELPNICTQICCPLCSLIACITTKMTKRYVFIEESKINENERSINISLRLSKFAS